MSRLCESDNKRVEKAREGEYCSRLLLRLFTTFPLDFDARRSFCSTRRDEIRTSMYAYAQPAEIPEIPDADTKFVNRAI